MHGSCTSIDRVDFEFTEDDWVGFVVRQNVGFQQRSIRQRRIVLFVVAGVIALTGVGWMRTGAPWPVTVPLWAFGLFLAYRAITFGRFYRQRSEKMLREMLQRKPHRGVLGRQHMSLSETGIAGTSVGVTFTRTWWAVADIESTTDYLYLYISSMSAYVIPARAFASGEHFEAFVTHARGLWARHRHEPPQLD